MKQQQTTFVIIKPDGIKNRHIGEIINRIENEGLEISFIKRTTLSKDQCKVHYVQHINKPFFKNLVSYMTSGSVIGMLVSGEDAIARMRRLAGATDPKEANPGTIRADFAESVDRNVIHTSDSVDAVVREFKNIFPESFGQLVNVTPMFDVQADINRHSDHVEELLQNARTLPDDDNVIDKVLKTIAKNNKG